MARPPPVPRRLPRRRCSPSDAIARVVATPWGPPPLITVPSRPAPRWCACPSRCGGASTAPARSFAVPIARRPQGAWPCPSRHLAALVSRWWGPGARRSLAVSPTFTRHGSAVGSPSRPARSHLSSHGRQHSWPSRGARLPGSLRSRSPRAGSAWPALGGHRTVALRGAGGGAMVSPVRGSWHSADCQPPRTTSPRCDARAKGPGPSPSGGASATANARCALRCNRRCLRSPTSAVTSTLCARPPSPSLRPTGRRRTHGKRPSGVSAPAHANGRAAPRPRPPGAGRLARPCAGPSPPRGVPPGTPRDSHGTRA